MLGAGSRCLVFEFSCLLLAAHAREQNRAENCCECGCLHNHTAECAAKSQRKCPIGRAGAVMRDLVHAAMCLCVPSLASPRCRSSSETTTLQTLRHSRQTHAHEAHCACTVARTRDRACTVRTGVLMSQGRCPRAALQHTQELTTPICPPPPTGENAPKLAGKATARPKPEVAKCRGAAGAVPRRRKAWLAPDHKIAIGFGLRPAPRHGLCAVGDAPVTESAAQPVSPSSYLI